MKNKINPLKNGIYIYLKREWAYSSVGQSARLISVRSVVQIYLGPPFWGYSSAGRAPALQAGGQRFESAYLHHFY